MRTWILPPALTSPTRPEKDIDSEAFQALFDEESEFDRYLARLALVARFGELTNGITRHPKR